MKTAAAIIMALAAWCASAAAEFKPRAVFHTSTGERTITPLEVYDWHENVAAMNATLRSALATYNRFVGYFRDLYSDNPTAQWIEPDNVSTNVNGYIVSAEMWGVLTLYNGAGGCPELMLDGRRCLVPIEFVPTTTNWVFHVNSENYVHKTTFDSNQQETE